MLGAPTTGILVASELLTFQHRVRYVLDEAESFASNAPPLSGSYKHSQSNFL